MTGLDPADWVGVWQGVEPDVVGTSNVETVLQLNGRFTSQASNAQAGTLVTMWGDWEINTFDRPMLRFTITGHEPTEFCGPLGCTPVLVPNGVSNYFRFVDRNTVVLAVPGCTDSSCEVMYWRVG